MSALKQNEFLSVAEKNIKQYILDMCRREEMPIRLNLISYTAPNKCGGIEQIAIYKVSYESAIGWGSDNDIFIYRKWDEDEEGTIDFYKFVCEV